MGKHIPVLLNETITGLNIKPDGIYMDLTLGRGGHSGEILKDYLIKVISMVSIKILRQSKTVKNI